MKKFSPEHEIPEHFWAAIEKAPSDLDIFCAYLEGLEKAVITELFRSFVEAKTELADVLITRTEVEGSSEDTIDGLADALVTQGRDAYLNAYYGKGKLPEWPWESMKTIGHLFSTVYCKRFGRNIFDDLDES